MSSKKNSKPKNIVRKDEKISSVIEIKEKDNKIIYVLILIIAILIALLVFFAFFKECKNNCDNCEKSTIEIEVDPKYQLVNYAGFTFKMPLDWNFVGDDSNNISNKEEKLFINFELINYDYNTFISDEIQRAFLESFQTSDNIKIDNTQKQDNYYLYEGSFNSYNYLVVALGNDKKTVLVKTKFVDKIAFDELKNDVIDFVISSISKDEG